jgi:hypothetical protein
MIGGPHQLTLRIRAPESYQMMAQSLLLELNGWQSPPQKVSSEWQELTFDLPRGIARSGLNDLRLHFATTFSLPPFDVRAGVRTQEVTALSAGEEIGDFGHIFVNGRDISPNQRGYNIAIIQPNGAIRTANFDTHLDPAASTAMANFILSAPAQALIAVAAADEASDNLNEEAVHALQAIDARGDLRGCFRCSHAFIHIASGETLEAVDALRPVGVTSGLGLTEPSVAALVEWIRIEPVEP